MNVVFLDVDGPLSNSRVHLSNGRIGGLWTDWDPLACKYIRERMCRDRNYRIVVSSTWRISRLDSLTYNLTKHKLHPYLFGYTPVVNKSRPTRWEEISAWLKENPVNDFLVIDDELGAIDHAHFDKLIHADPEDGLTVAHYRQLNRILGYFP